MTAQSHLDALDEARRRYFEDAEFHAEVYTTLQIVREASGQQVDKRMEGVIVISAALALVLREKETRRE